MSSNWITDAEIARTQRLIALAQLSREAGESAADAIGRMADWMRAEAIAAFERDYPAWAEDSIRLSSALDAGDCPTDVAEAYYLRSVPYGTALMALDAVGGDDLVAAWNAVPTLPMPAIDIPGIDLPAAPSVSETARQLAELLRDTAAMPFPRSVTRLHVQRLAVLIEALEETDTRDAIVREGERLALGVLAEDVSRAAAAEAIATRLRMWAAVLERRASPTLDGDA